MDWLNYHHLRYFWVVSREGSIVKAADKLNVAQPTISGQIRELEKSLGEELFTRIGRNLALTETGRLVQRYADEIFGLGQEMVQALQGHSQADQRRVTIGIADVVPKLVVHHLVEAVFASHEGAQVSCIEGEPDFLLSELAQHHLDVVISDAPIPPTIRVRAYNHLLGESGVILCGVKELARKYRPRFPESLDGAPLLLPTGKAVLRRDVEDWIESLGIHPNVRGEFDDSALIKVVGQSGAGLFFVPSILEKEVKKQYGVEKVGTIDAIRERFYAISVNRRFKNPAVIALSEKAKTLLHAK
ncbi:MAG: transcriptional activator NhaR [Planctomycetota bacterium]